MPTQFFKVTRAPEAKEIAPQEIKHALMDVRDDTEWEVKEFIQEDCIMYKCEVASLKGRIEQLEKEKANLTEMLIEVRDNPNNNVFEKFELGEM